MRNARRIPRLIPLAVVLFFELPLGAQEWVKVGQCPPFPHVLLASDGGVFVGVSVDRDDRTSLFWTASERKPRSQTIDSRFDSLAAGASARFNRLCVPRTDDSTVVCWDSDLRMVERFPVPVKVDSLAMTSGEEIWILPYAAPGSSPTLIQWRRGSGGWRRTGRTLTVDTTDRASRIERFEVRSIDEKTVALVPLMGSFEATRVTYPAPWIWSTESGPAARLAPRTLVVDRAIQDMLARVRGHSLRLVFNSAASKTHVAIIPALLEPDDRPPRHDEVWWRDLKQGRWQVSKLPGAVGAVALDDRDVFAATEDGRILRHTISPR